nr:hypothetical protein [Gemmatimonadaceae bacterium]
MSQRRSRAASVSLITITLALTLPACVPDRSVTATAESDPSLIVDNGKFPTSRDPWLWPFDTRSIWNMPIGSNAQYVPAGFQRSQWLGVDVEWHLKVSNTDRLVPLYAPYSWTRRCNGTSNPQWDWRGGIRILLPDSLIVPDAVPPSTPNSVTAILQPDGRSLLQVSPLARCAAGGPAYGWTTHNGNEPLDDLYGDGIRGGHAGSGLSSIGGSIRRGELVSGLPIRHALKLNVWANRYLFYRATDSTPGYRWPARNADAYAADAYRGTNPAVEQGTLVAIPPSVNLSTIGLTTSAGRILARTLRDYGAYIVDDAAWNAFDFSAEVGVAEEFQQRFGYGMNAGSGPFYEDIMLLLPLLHVVDNNAPNAIGGGGRPRQPLAPP